MKPEIPEKELRTKSTNLFAAARVICCVTKQGDISDIKIWNSIQSILNYSNSLSKVMNILARVTRGWKYNMEVQLSRLNSKALEIVSKPPSPSELETAERLVFLSAMPATFTAYKEGKLDSLIPKVEGTIIVTTGRLGEKSLSTLLGKSALPVLMSSSRAAYLYIYREHCGKDNMVHKSAVETLARTRAFVWIVRGKQLAKTVVKNCPMCIKQRKEITMQQMAMHKPENVEMCKP